MRALHLAQYTPDWVGSEPTLSNRGFIYQQEPQLGTSGDSQSENSANRSPVSLRAVRGSTDNARWSAGARFSSCWAPLERDRRRFVGSHAHTAPVGEVPEIDVLRDLEDEVARHRHRRQHTSDRVHVRAGVGMSTAIASGALATIHAARAAEGTDHGLCHTSWLNDAFVSHLRDRVTAS